jgi:hypothetical protein
MQIWVDDGCGFKEGASPIRDAKFLARQTVTGTPQSIKKGPA